MLASASDPRFQRLAVVRGTSSRSVKLPISETKPTIASKASQWSNQMIRRRLLSRRYQMRFRFTSKLKLAQFNNARRRLCRAHGKITDLCAVLRNAVKRRDQVLGGFHVPFVDERARLSAHHRLVVVNK